MSITKEQVKHIAQLARLGITEQEEEKFQKHLSDILKFIDQLNEVKTDKVKPIGQVVGLRNAFREDKTRPISKQDKDKLLKLAPAMKNNHVKVKTVL